jgi:PAS domain S-box-containing protein
MTNIAPTHEEMLAMNEALVLGSLRQHELTEAAETLNARLQEEIAERKQVEAALRESEDRYRGLFNSIDEGFCVIEKVEGGVGAPPDFLYLEANPAFAAQSGMSGMVGKTIRQILPDEPDGWCSIYDTVLRTGKPIRFEREFVTYGRMLELYAFRVEDENHRRVAVIFKDITLHKRAEEALRKWEYIFNHAGWAVVVADPETNHITMANPAFAQMHGYTVEEMIGKPLADSLAVESRGELPGHLEGANKQRDYIYESLHLRKDGTVFPALTHVSALKDAEGQLLYRAATVRDITERKQAEERQHFLMNELAHRGKNLLAVVHSIASRTMSGTRSLAEAREVLVNRIQALARSQTALMAGGFEYAPLAEIVRREFEAFSDRVTTDGADVMLNPKAAQTFALLVHELATNATKHGALSQPAGRVSIQWEIEDAGEEAKFRFQWQEHDGPLVKPPNREGFGRMLLEKVVAQHFGAKPKINFAPEGLSYEIHAPLSVVAAGRPANA